MKHHFADLLDRDGGDRTIVPNRERYAYRIGDVPAGSKEITIVMIGKEDDHWSRALTLPNLEELTLHQPTNEQLDAIAGLGAHSVHFDATSADGGLAGVELDPECTGYPTAIACTLSGGGSADAPDLAEGTYYLRLAATDANDRGPVSVTATLGPAYPPPANDTCSSPELLDLTASSQSFSADTRGAANDFDGQATGCYVANARDVVYQLNLPSSRGHAQLQVTGTSAGFAPVIQLADGCGPGSSSACGLAPDGGSVATAAIATPGTIGYFWVESEDQAGSFTGSAQWTAAPANGTYTITVTPSGFDAAVGVFVGCSATTCTASANQAGVDGTETVTLSASRNTTYLIDVRGNQAGGPFTISVQ